MELEYYVGVVDLPLISFIAQYVMSCILNGAPCTYSMQFVWVTFAVHARINFLMFSLYRTTFRLLNLRKGLLYPTYVIEIRS
jgi:hypothetical protein